MELFVWDARYLTGEALVDAEHHGLVNLINRVVELQAQPDAAAQQMRVVDELVAYAVEHFQHEEALMGQTGCDARHVAMHCGLHRDFAQQVGQMRGEGSAHTDLEYLLRFLSGWLAYHILGVDQVMARQLQHIRAGMTPAEAFEQEAGKQADPATASLLQAMQTLNSVVVQRNQQLQDFNLQLETKVEERTRDLAEAKRGLEARNAELQTLNTRLAEVRQQLLQAEKLASLGQLAAGVAHEINNPIGFVQSNIRTLGGYLQELLNAVDVPAGQAPGKVDLEFLREDIPALVSESQEGIERVKKIVQDLRAFSQVDSAQSWASNRIKDCLDATLGMLGGVLGKARILREEGDLPAVWCSASQLNQVFASLLTNAAEALPAEGGAIRIRSGVAGEEVWIDIADNGRGIAPDVLPKIFDPFFTTKAIGDGTGMGLAQAYGIMQQHKGRIEVRSEPGKGSCFRVILPIKAA